MVSQVSRSLAGQVFIYLIFHLYLTCNIHLKPIANMYSHFIHATLIIITKAVCLRFLRRINTTTTTMKLQITTRCIHVRGIYRHPVTILLTEFTNHDNLTN